MRLEIVTEALKLTLGGEIRKPSARQWVFTLPDSPYRAAVRLVVTRQRRQIRELRERAERAETERDHLRRMGR